MTFLLTFLLVFASQKPQPSGSIALNEPAPYAHGDVITFETTTDRFPSGRKYLSPWVLINCFQDGYPIYGASGYPDDAFVLGQPSPSQWDVLGGTIQCVGELGYFTLRDAEWHAVAVTPMFEVTRP